MIHMMGRVCILRQSIYPLDLLVRREAETLHQAGLETHVICLEKLEKEDVDQKNEVINGVYVHRLPLKRKKTSITRYVYDYLSFAFMAAVKLTLLHLKDPFDIIQVNTMPDFLVFATIIPKILGAKVISMMYEPTPELWETIKKSPPPRLLKIVEKLVLAYVDISFTVTQQLKEKYIARGANPAKIQVILNVPDANFFELQGAEAAELPCLDAFVLISHGAIEERYGQDTMLDAIALVKSQIPNIRLRILGKGTYVDELLVKRSQLGLEECVDYLGWVTSAQMIHEICGADAGIVAQKSSSYSNLVHTGKMYEYIALGKPVLESRLKAVEAYFDRDSLEYFEPGDPRSLADRILNLYRYPERRITLVKNAQRLYDEYKWDRQKEIYLSVYRRFLN